MKLNFIHIGKCGGSSVLNALVNSEIIKEKYNSILYTHTIKPIYQRNEDYIITIRNPISRLLSAYNWRYYLVVESENQKNRFKGEWEILNKYKTLNNMAEKLFDECTNSVDLKVSQEFEVIHHIRERISFYLLDFLDVVNINQIYGVLKQESLEQDCKKLLGVEIPHLKNHKSKTLPTYLNLSEKALNNLKRHFSDEFTCVKKLFELGIIDEEDYKILENY